MERLFGRPKTEADYAAESNVAIRNAERMARRQKDRAEGDQVKTVNEIRDKARSGAGKAALRTLAKTLVRQRNCQRRFERMESQFGALSTKMKEVRAMSDMNKAMESVARAVKMMNGQMSPAKVARTARTIEYETAKMDSNMELFDEMIDGIMAEDDEEEETDDVLDKILDEIGISVKEKLSNASVPSGGLASSTTSRGATNRGQTQQLPVVPTGAPSVPHSHASDAPPQENYTPEDTSDAALEARLRNLNRGEP